MARTAIDGNLTELNLGGIRQTASELALHSLAQSFKPNDDYEKMQFYYPPPDHLGSSSYITNLDGEVMQHIEYVPFGEVFIEELELTRKSATAGKANCNNIWNTPYLFNDCANEGRGKLACSMPSAANRRVKLNDCANEGRGKLACTMPSAANRRVTLNDCANEGRGKLACTMPSAANRRVELNAKELDEETGMYYYGARYYEPRLSLWMSTDSDQEKYPHYTSYLFVGSNPINAIDPDGNKIVFINGKIGGGSPAAGEPYWNGSNSDFVNGAKSFFHDNKVVFTDADYGYLSTARKREKSGYEYAKTHYKQWIADMGTDEPFYLVSHSMGAAFSKGVEKYLKEMGRRVEYNVMINTYQVNRINNPKSDETLYIDYQNTNDPVLFWFDINLGKGSLMNADVKIREKSDAGILYIHRSPIDSDSKFWEKIKNHLPSNND